MIYSKWDNSVWHTYWVYIHNEKKYKLPTEELKNSQTFEICDTPSFNVTYGDLKEYGIDRVIEEVIELYSKPYDCSGLIWNPNTCKSEYKESIYPAKNPTDKDIEELKGYLNRFMIDMDEKFKLGYFIKNYWIKPFLKKFSNNKIIIIVGGCVLLTSCYIPRPNYKKFTNCLKYNEKTIN